MQILKEYIIEYLKRVAKFIYRIDILISIIFIITCLIFRSSWIVVIQSLLMLFSFASIIFLVDLFLSIRCLLMVRSQEKKYNVILSLKSKDILENKKLKLENIILTKDWLICIGSKAFYKETIKKISSERYRARFNGYYIRIYTDDSKYTIDTTHYYVVKTIKDWFKS